MKNAQTSIFVIAGISLLVLLGIFLLVEQNFTESPGTPASFSKQQYFSAQQTVLDTFIQECVKRTTIDAETKLGISEDISSPLIKEYLLDNLPVCFDDFNEFERQGYKITKGEMTVKVRINYDVMTVDLWHPVKVQKGNSLIAFNYNYYEFPRTIMEKLNADGLTTIVSADGSIRLEIPAGTKATLNGKEVDKIGFKILDRNFENLENSVVAGMLTFQGLPDGAKFDKPVKITRYFDYFDIPIIIKADDLALGYYNKEIGMWIGVPTQVDTAKQMLTAEVMHFTPFATVTECKSGEATLTLKDVIVNPWTPYSGWIKGSEAKKYFEDCSGTPPTDNSLLTFEKVNGNGDQPTFARLSFPGTDVVSFTQWKPFECKKTVGDCNSCPSGGTATCEEQAPTPNPDDVKYDCSFTATYFEKNTGDTGDNFPAGQAIRSVDFKEKGNTCIYEDTNTEHTFDANGYPGSTVADASSSIINGDSANQDAGIKTITISPEACANGDKCAITNSKLTLESNVPKLSFLLEVLNIGSDETQLQGDVTVTFAGGVGIPKDGFKYNCEKVYTGSQYKLIGGECFECKDGATGTFYESVESAKCTNANPKANDPCIENLNGIQYCDGKEVCLKCTNGVWVAPLAGMAACAFCSNHPDKPIDIQLVKVTGMAAGNSNNPSSTCLTPAELSDLENQNQDGGSGGLGGDPTTPGNGGGGSGNRKCEGGDSEVKRYDACPNIDFETKYKAKKFKINSGEGLDSRSLKFCDTGDLTKTSTEFIILGSAFRDGECWLLVEPNDDPNHDYYVRKSQVDSSTTLYGGSTSTCLAPSIPQNFMGEALGKDSISLKWNIVPEAEKYLVFMNGINIVETKNSTYNVTGLMQNTFYLFNVTTVNSTFCINMSNATITLNITLNTLIQEHPLIKSFTKTSDTFTSAFLSWEINGPHDSSKLVRNKTIIYEGPLREFNDTGLERWKGYYYELYVYKDNVTDNINATFKTQETSIEITGFRVDTSSSNSISLVWSTEGEYSSSDLYRDYLLIYSGPNKNFVDTGLQPNTQHFYELYAIFNPIDFDYENATFSTKP